MAMVFLKVSYCFLWNPTGNHLDELTHILLPPGIDGHQYEGEFKRGALDGQGTYEQKDGRRYVGQVGGYFACVKWARSRMIAHLLV